MANNTNLGFEHRFAFAPTGVAFNHASARTFEVVSSTVRAQKEVLDATGVLGNRTRREDRSRYGLTRIGGQLVFEPSPNMFDFFLPYILGTAESTDTFAAANSLPGFDMLHDPFGTGSEATKFTELYVNRMSLRFAAGLLRLTLDVVGKTETLDQTFTANALGSTATVDAPYVFYDTSGLVSSGGFTLLAQADLEIEEGELIIDNVLDVKFRNSRTASSIRASDLIVTLVCHTPLTASQWNTFYNDTAATNATIEIDNGTVETIFTLQNLKLVDSGPGMGGKDEVPLILSGSARGDASDTFAISAVVTGGGL
jgi:hypothetical protein